MTTTPRWNRRILGRRIPGTDQRNARQKELDALGMPWCGVDALGNRYTQAVGAVPGDWWYGSTILSNSVLVDLAQRGLLPLREVDPRTGEEIA